MSKKAAKVKGKARATTGGTALAEKPGKPAPQTLKGMEDGPIKDLEAEAHEYAKYRDKRMQWGRDESASKERLLDLMKKHKKDHYKRDGIEITLVTEKENVKVKISDGDEGGAE
jgi:hypothetical protein